MSRERNLFSRLNLFRLADRYIAPAVMSENTPRVIIYEDGGDAVKIARRIIEGDLKGQVISDADTFYQAVLINDEIANGILHPSSILVDSHLTGSRIATDKEAARKKGILDYYKVPRDLRHHFSSGSLLIGELNIIRESSKLNFRIIGYSAVSDMVIPGYADLSPDQGCSVIKGTVGFTDRLRKLIV